MTVMVYFCAFRGHIGVAGIIPATRLFASICLVAARWAGADGLVLLGSPGAW